MIRNFLWITLLLLACNSCNPAVPILDRSLRSPNPHLPVVKTRHFVPMSDGTRLSTLVYSVSNSSGDLPCLLIRLPLPTGMKHTFFSSTLARAFAERGFHTIVQNIRGWPPSEGKFEPFAHERSDGVDTLRWIRTLPFGACQVHTWGGSYFGITQWAIADLTSGAKVIQISSPLLAKTLFPNETFDAASALFWIGRNSGTLPSAEAILDSILENPLENAEQAIAGASVPYYRDWLLRGSEQAYWQSLIQHPPYQDVRGPALLMAGWFDPFLEGQIIDFQGLARRKESTALVIGPWGSCRHRK
jgi:putative CocE/NonD family hydrolase